MLSRFADEDHYYRATGGGVGHCLALSSQPITLPDNHSNVQESEELQQFGPEDDGPTSDEDEVNDDNDGAEGG